MTWYYTWYNSHQPTQLLQLKATHKIWPMQMLHLFHPIQPNQLNTWCNGCNHVNGDVLVSIYILHVHFLGSQFHGARMGDGVSLLWQTILSLSKPPLSFSKPPLSRFATPATLLAPISSSSSLLAPPVSHCCTYFCKNKQVSNYLLSGDWRPKSAARDRVQQLQCASSSDETVTSKTNVSIW